MVADGWQNINIGRDTTLKARIGWQGLTVKEYKENGEYYLVTGTDFERGLVNWNTCHYVDKYRYTQDKYIQLKNGDILITKDGTIGKVGYVENLTLPATLNSGVFVLRPKNRNYDTKYLYYIFTSSIFDEFLTKLVAGSTINHLYQKDFVNFEFKVPNIQQQQAIAKALSDTDELINSLEKLIAKKEAIKTGTMQELLTGKKRLNGFSGEWEVKMIKEIASIQTGSKNTQDKVTDGKYPFYVRSQIVESINSYSFDGESVLTAGDGVGVGKVFHYINDKFDYHQRVYNICNFKINGFFFYQYFKNNFFDRAMSMTAKSSVDSVRKEMISEMEIPIPPTIKEQTAIAEILSDMDSDIEALKTKLSKVKAIKEGMMQELLTGKTRLLEQEVL